MATDKQVQAQIDKNAKLRAELKQAREGREADARAADNETKLAQLKADEEKLAREIEFEKRLKKATDTKARQPSRQTAPAAGETSNGEGK